MLLAHVQPPQSFVSLLQTIVLRLVLPMVALEMAFLTFPATPQSSAVLQVVHAFILCQVMRPLEPIVVAVTETKKDATKPKVS